MKKEINQALLNLDYTLPLNDDETVERFFCELEGLKDINMLFSVRTMSSNNDYWLQADYYSDKLGKTIILSHDFDGYFEDATDIEEVIEKTNQEVREIEDRLPNLSPCA